MSKESSVSELLIAMDRDIADKQRAIEALRSEMRELEATRRYLMDQIIASARDERKLSKSGR